MDIIMNYISIEQIILYAALLLLLIWNFTLSFKLKELKRRFNRFTRGGQTSNLEQTIEQYTNEMDQIKRKINQHTEEIEIMVKKLSGLKGRVAILRYNAFDEAGNDLSFSIAFLDEKKDGIVITSIYNRGQSNTYAKPIHAMTSDYKLSKEEISVLEMALKS